MQTTSEAGAWTSPSASTKDWALGLPALRVALVAAASALTWAVVNSIEPGTAFPPPPMLAAAAMLPVNVVCLWLVARLLRTAGHSIRGLLAFDRRRILSDLVWGLLWLVVLYLPFAATIMLVTWLQHGDEMFVRMETIFFNPASIPTLTPVAWAVIGIIGALTFAPLNSPAEEVLYRGYARVALERRGRRATAILLPSALFGLQHVWYAPTPDAVLSFACAFFVWGIGSAFIARRQGRLMPLVCAHGLVNLVFTLPALAVPFLPAMNGA